MTTEGSAGSWKTVAEYAGYIAAVVGAIKGLFELIQLFKDTPSLNVIIFLYIAAIVIWISCLSRTLRNWQGKRLKIKQWSTAGAIAIPLIFFACFFGWSYIQNLPSKQAIVLVAEFQNGEKGDDALVTKTLFSNLEAIVDDDPTIDLDYADAPFKESEEARSFGENKKAALVIWGWYGRPSDERIDLVSMNFEVLQPFKAVNEDEEASKLIEAANETREIDCNRLKQIGLRTQISQKMGGLTLFALGMAKYAKEDWDGAINYFIKALDQLKQSDQEVKKDLKSVVHNLLGRSYDAKGDLENAIANYNEAIKLNPQYYRAYTNRGNVYYDQDKYNLAFSDYQEAIGLSVKQNAEYARAYKGRADVYKYGYANLNKAIADYEKAISLDSEHVCSHNNLGNAYADQENYEKAIDHYDEALRLDPNHRLTYANRAKVRFAQGDYKKMIDDYTKAIEPDPENGGRYLGWASENFDTYKGNNGKAFEAYNEAISQNLENSVAYLLRARFYADQRYEDKALEDYNKVIALYDQDASRYFLRARFYAERGKYEAALKDYEAAIRLDSKNAGRYFDLADFYAEQGKAEEALKNYKEAIKFDSKNAGRYFDLADFYAEQGKAEEALKNYEEAINLDQKYARPYLKRADFYAEQAYQKQDQKQDQKYYKRAIDDYEKAIELDPENPYYYWALADFHAFWASDYTANIDKDALAIANYNKAIERAPENPYYYASIADFYAEHNDSQRAIANYNKAIERAPENPDYYTYLAEFYAEHNDTQKAIENYTEAINRSPEYLRASYYAIRADFYANQDNKLQEAITDYNDAIRLAPREPSYYLERASVHAEQGNKREAIEDFKRVLEVTENSSLEEDSEYRKQAEEQLKKLS